MSESKEPEGTPVAQGSTAQQGTQTTTPPPTEGSAGAAGAAPALADRIPDAAPGATGDAPAASGATGAAPAGQQTLQPVFTAMEDAITAEERALTAIRAAQPVEAVAVPAASGTAVAASTIQQAMQPLVEAMQGAVAAEKQALEDMQAAERRARAAMQPAVTMMQQAVETVTPVVEAMEEAIAAERRALTAMQSDKQGDKDADGAARDLVPAGAPNGGGMLRDTEGVLRDPQSGTDGSFYDQLKGVPIDYLIATPLISAARANLALGVVMTQFIDEIGYVVKDNKKTTRLIEFELTRPVKDNLDQKLKTQTITVKAPLLAVVPLPALLIDTVNVDLTVEISQATQQKVTDTRSADLTVGGRYAFITAQFTGSCSVKQENTRDTNQKAKYEIRVGARQQPLPEGMSKLMDVFASTIEPLESPTVQ